MKEKKLLGITSCEKLSNDKIVFWVKNTNRVFLYDLKKKESIRYIEIDDCDVRTTTFFGSTLLDETLVLAPYRDRKMPFVWSRSRHCLREQNRSTHLQVQEMWKVHGLRGYDGRSG